MKVLPVFGLAVVALVALGGGQRYLKHQEAVRIEQQEKLAKQAEAKAEAVRLKAEASAAATAQQAKDKEEQDQLEYKVLIMSQLKNTTEVYVEFLQVDSVASRTPRVNLAAQISRLQDIRKRADHIDVTGCATNVLSQAKVVMDLTTLGLTSFLGRNEELSRGLDPQIEMHKEKYTTEYDLCSRNPGFKSVI